MAVWVDELEEDARLTRCIRQTRKKTGVANLMATIPDTSNEYR